MEPVEIAAPARRTTPTTPGAIRRRPTRTSRRAVPGVGRPATEHPRQVVAATAVSGDAVTVFATTACSWRSRFERTSPARPDGARPSQPRRRARHAPRCSEKAAPIRRATTSRPKASVYITIALEHVRAEPGHPGTRRRGDRRRTRRVGLLEMPCDVAITMRRGRCIDSEPRRDGSPTASRPDTGRVSIGPARRRRAAGGQSRVLPPVGLSLTLETETAAQGPPPRHRVDPLRAASRSGREGRRVPAPSGRPAPGAVQLARLPDQPLPGEGPRVVQAFTADLDGIWAFIEQAAGEAAARVAHEPGQDVRRSALASVLPSVVVAPLLGRLALVSNDGGAGLRVAPPARPGSTTTGPCGPAAPIITGSNGSSSAGPTVGDAGGGSGSTSSAPGRSLRARGRAPRRGCRSSDDGPHRVEESARHSPPTSTRCTARSSVCTSPPSLGCGSAAIRTPARRSTSTGPEIKTDGRANSAVDRMDEYERLRGGRRTGRL